METPLWQNLTKYLGYGKIGDIAVRFSLHEARPLLKYLEIEDAVYPVTMAIQTYANIY